MRADFDVAVAGLGITGAAVTLALTRRGQRVLGLDRHARGHDRGSSHGQSRIIREAYYEHPLYVPLVQRAHALWLELELETGIELYRRTGGINAGPAAGALVRGALASVREHGLPHEVLDAAEIRRRFPALSPTDETVAVFEERAGVLNADACLNACLDGAARRGADLRFERPLLGWSGGAGAVELDTAAGPVTAGHLVLAAGGWAGSLLGDGLELPLRVERQPVHHFSRPEGAPSGGAFPVTLWEYAEGRMLYFLPDPVGGVKASVHHEGETCAHPTQVDRGVRPEEAERVAGLLRRFAPGLAGPFVKSAVCLYTNTPDAHFILDRHPAAARVVIASPCSGHGFKFAPAVAEAVADLVANDSPRFDLSPFALGRFPG